MSPKKNKKAIGRIGDRRWTATEKAEKALEKAAETLEKYRKNKTLVSPAELAGRYKKPFEKLKQQLKGELGEYLRLFVLGGLQIRDDSEGQQVVAEINQAFIETQIGRRVGRAAFREFDLEEIRRIAEEYRQRVMMIYEAYFDRHICLYAAGPSWDPGNPQPPLIYNNIVDQFYDEAEEKWMSKEKPPGAAILIFVKNIKVTEEDNHEHTGEHKEI